jgi:primosomal protein N'
MVNPFVMNPWIWKNPGPFQVGDRVLVPFGGGKVEATVIEDRGDLGPGRTRIYRVRFRVDDVSPAIEDEMLVDDLTLVARAPESKPKPKRKKRPRE